MISKKLKINISKEIGSVSGLLILPDDPQAMMVLSHGAGAGMEHPFMEMLAQRLAIHKIATLRFNFPYKEKGKGPPDRPKKAHPAIIAATAKASAYADGISLIAGGKSFGGRMTSMCAAKADLEELKGIVYYGFPLHPIGKPGVERAAHFPKILIPQLFLQGTRDKLARIDLIEEICNSFDNAKLVVIEGADHSFKTLKSSGVKYENVIELLAEETAKFCANL